MALTNVAEAKSGGWIIRPEDPILITGANGFVGLQVVRTLLRYGFHNLRCFARPSAECDALSAAIAGNGAGPGPEIVRGNLLSPRDCAAAAGDVAAVYHLAAGRGDMVADAYMNSVVTTRNLLEACRGNGRLRRFVNTSSFSVYSNRQKPGGRLLDERSPLEDAPAKRGDAYTFAKVKQDEIVTEYGEKHGLPYVMVRPGVVYGPGKSTLTNRVGIGTFGLFLHLGGSNRIPFTYVENCAEAIVLAGLVPGVEREAFNIVDDDLPTSRRFLRLYKQRVRRFRSVYVPHAVSYVFCCLWEKYSEWSAGQLPPAFNWRGWHVFYKRTRYSNAKLKSRLGWTPRVTAAEAMDRFFESCRAKEGHA
jgi:nucleoside-diphosphate-sugar epimerase